jgi:hypothetical protein
VESEEKLKKVQTPFQFLMECVMTFSLSLIGEEVASNFQKHDEAAKLYFTRNTWNKLHQITNKSTNYIMHASN